MWMVLGGMHWNLRERVQYFKHVEFLSSEVAWYE